MKNKEKFAKEIVEAVISCEGFGLERETREIKSCDDDDMHCEHCYFNKGYGILDCNENKLKWAEEESKNPYEITFVENTLLWDLYNKGLKYIVRDKIGGIRVFYKKPIRISGKWIDISEDSDFDCEFCLGNFFDRSFMFVKWEDEEPIKIEDVVTDCVIVGGHRYEE